MRCVPRAAGQSFYIFVTYWRTKRMRFDRRIGIGIASALCAVIALGALAAALEATAVPSAYQVPDAGGTGSGTTILEAILLLISAVLEFFGIDIELGVPGGAARSLLGLVFSVAAAMYPDVIVLGVVFLAAAAGLFTRRRLERSAAAASLRRAAAIFRWRRWRPERDPDESDSVSWPPATPDDDALRAWAELTGELDVSHPRARTPGEWAEAAVDAGYDSAYVEIVTRRFRAVRYGGEQAASRRQDRTPNSADESEADPD
ncbi:DUF4129 domain-containing protein [Halopiger thermotolerans]